MADASKISVEQQARIEEKDVDVVTSPQSRSREDPEVGKALTQRLLSWGVESRGEYLSIRVVIELISYLYLNHVS